MAMASNKKQQVLTDHDVAKLLAAPKRAALAVDWQKHAGYNPAAYKWRSAVMVDGVVVEGLVVGMEWRVPEFGEISKFYMQLIFHSQRVYAVDMAVQRHRNPVVPGKVYSGAIVSDQVHEHRWASAYADRYVEPVDLPADEYGIYNYFCTEAGISVPGSFHLPGGLSGSLF